MSLVVNFYQIESPEKTLFTSGFLIAAQEISIEGHIVCKFRVKLKSIGLLPKSYTFISNRQYEVIKEKARIAGVE